MLHNNVARTSWGIGAASFLSILRCGVYPIVSQPSKVRIPKKICVSRVRGIHTSHMSGGNAHMASCAHTIQ